MTEEGQILFEYCESIQGKIDEVPNKLDNLAEEIHGQLKLQTISNLVSPRLDRILLGYNKRYPFVELDISIVPWEGISKAVLRNQVDIGIAPVSVVFPELRYDFLFSEVHRLYCSNEHHLFGQTISDFSQITNEPFVLTGNDEVKDGLLWPLTKEIKDLMLDIYIISHPQIPESRIRQYFIKEFMRTDSD